MKIRPVSATLTALLCLLATFIAGCSEDLTGLVVEDLKIGDGREARSGKWLTVQYTGRLADGTEFGSGRAIFELGGGEVIKGWDAGFEGMKVGGRRKLTIPPHLAYGSKGAGDVIPPDATLTFVVVLTRIED